MADFCLMQFSGNLCSGPPEVFSRPERLQYLPLIHKLGGRGQLRRGDFSCGRSGPDRPAPGPMRLFEIRFLFVVFDGGFGSRTLSKLLRALLPAVLLSEDKPLSSSYKTIGTKRPLARDSR